MKKKTRLQGKPRSHAANIYYAYYRIRRWVLVNKRICVEDRHFWRDADPNEGWWEVYTVRAGAA